MHLRARISRTEDKTAERIWLRGLMRHRLLEEHFVGVLTLCTNVSVRAHLESLPEVQLTENKAVQLLRICIHPHGHVNKSFRSILVEKDIILEILELLVAKPFCFRHRIT